MSDKMKYLIIFIGGLMTGTIMEKFRDAESIIMFYIFVLVVCVVTIAFSTLNE